MGRRLLETLSPWQLLCFQAKRLEEEGELQSWQGRVQYLEQLLQECKDEFNRELRHFSDPVIEGHLLASPLALTSAPEVLKFSDSKADKEVGRKMSQETENGLQTVQGEGVIDSMSFEGAGAQETSANVDADMDNLKVRI